METWAQYIRTYKEKEGDMSDFAEACRRLIDTSGSNVYQIAKRSGLDRTTLQKMVQGTRLPSRAFVEEFCEYLLINNAERDELLRLFQIEKVGRERYFCRCEVENLLCNFQNLKNSLDDAVYRRSICVERDDAAAGASPAVRRLSTDVDIITAIQYIILKACADDSSVSVYMDIFPNAEYAMQQILHEKRRGARVRCCQFINFYHQNGSRHGLQQNVKTLHTVLSCAFAAPDGYEIRYFYKMIDEPDFCRIWPHYLITPYNLLLLAEDGKNGILIEEESIAREYTARLRTMRKKGKNLLAFSGSPEQVLADYGENVFKGKMSLSFDTMLCMGDIVSRVVEEKLAGERTIESEAAGEAENGAEAPADEDSTQPTAAKTGIPAGRAPANGAAAAAGMQTADGAAAAAGMRTADGAAAAAGMQTADGAAAAAGMRTAKGAAAAAGMRTADGAGAESGMQTADGAAAESGMQDAPDQMAAGSVVSAAAQEKQERLRRLEYMYRELGRQRDAENTFTPDYRRFCCMNGLDEFLEDGTLPGIYGEYLGPVEEELRAKVLREYICSMEERGNEYIIKDDVGIPADGLNIELYEPNRVFIYSARQDLPFGSVCIEEPGLFLVFKDYFESLEEEEKAYSAKESAEILKKRCVKLVEKYFPDRPGGGTCSGNSS